MATLLVEALGTRLQGGNDVAAECHPYKLSPADHLT